MKTLGDFGIGWTFKLLENIWKPEEMPQDWRVSEMVTIYKRKGDNLECNSHRGIKLLEHILKVIERVIDQRLRGQVNIHEYQFGFMPGRSTVIAIFIMRQVQEKFLECNRKLYYCFVDLEKAYGRVMNKETKTLVHTPCGDTDPFCVNVGLHQGSALSPFLFLIVIDILTSELREEEPQDLWKLLFADDLVSVAETEEELQRRYLAWKEKMNQGGSQVNMSKTEGMMSSKTGREEMNLRSEEGRRIQQSTEYKYLGSVFTEGGTEQAVRQRVKEVWRKWTEVTGIVLDKKIPLKLKIMVYKTILRPVLLYRAETWALRRKEENLLERMEMRMVRWIAGISLRERRESADRSKIMEKENLSG
nr:uncharacterized protein LOC113821128 [Penaeus vannamei]